MQRSVLEQILRQQPGITPASESFVVTDAVVVDLLASTGSEVATLLRLREIRLREEYLAAVTEKTETYFLEYQHVLALRVKPGAGRAGFST